MSAMNTLVHSWYTTTAIDIDLSSFFNSNFNPEHKLLCHRKFEAADFHSLFTSSDSQGDLTCLYTSNVVVRTFFIRASEHLSHRSEHDGVDMRWTTTTLHASDTKFIFLLRLRRESSGMAQSFVQMVFPYPQWIMEYVEVGVSHCTHDLVSIINTITDSPRCPPHCG